MPTTVTLAVYTRWGLIKDDIKAVKTSPYSYPSLNELGSEESINFLPQSLRVLLIDLFVGKYVPTKIASVGQSIMYATWPWVFWHHFGLVWVCKSYASQFLIASLHKHDFCMVFAAHIMKCTNIELWNWYSWLLITVCPVRCRQCWLQHQNSGWKWYLPTFHGMGMITPEIKKL